MSNMWQKEVTRPTLLLPLLIIIIMPLFFFFFKTPKPKTKPKQKWWHYTTSIWLLRDLLFLPHSRYLWPREAPEHGERTMNDWAEYPLYYSYDRVLFGFFGFSIKEEEEEERREETIIAILAFATIRDWRANGFFFFHLYGTIMWFSRRGNESIPPPMCSSLYTKIGVTEFIFATPLPLRVFILPICVVHEENKNRTGKKKKKKLLRRSTDHL